MDNRVINVCDSLGDGLSSEIVIEKQIIRHNIGSTERDQIFALVIRKALTEIIHHIND